MSNNSSNLKDPLILTSLNSSSGSGLKTSQSQSQSFSRSHGTNKLNDSNSNAFSTSALSASVFELDLKKEYYKVTIVTSGSRGDVQPYIALGLYLQTQGHLVTIATERRMQSLVEEFNLSYFAIEGDAKGVVFEPQAQQVLQDGSMMKLIKLTEDWEKKFNKEEIYDSYLQACEGSNLIVASPLVLTGTYSVAEFLGVKWMPVILGPTMPTTEFPIWPLKNFIICSCLNKWSYNVAFKMLWKSESKTINPWRQRKLGKESPWNIRSKFCILIILTVSSRSGTAGRQSWDI